MNRRNFLRSMLGVAAATALPSEIWPFRKIFVLPAPAMWIGIDPGVLTVEAVIALELEYYRKQIPYLLYRPNVFGLMRSKYPGRLTAASAIAIKEQSWERINASMARLVQK